MSRERGESNFGLDKHAKGLAKCVSHRIRGQPQRTGEGHVEKEEVSTSGPIELTKGIRNADKDMQS